MNTAMPVVDPKLIPSETGKKLFAATLIAMRRIQQEFPSHWQRIEDRAKELQKSKA